MSEIEKTEQQLAEEAKQYLVRVVIEETDKARIESERKLKNALIPMVGRDKAEDIANYFFGQPAGMQTLTVNLLKELKLIK